jgi:hypothetical protein
MNWVNFELDEAPIFRLRDRHGYPKGDRLEVFVSGFAVMKYRAVDDWWLDELHIDASNGKYFKDTVSWKEQIFPEHPLWNVVKEYLENVAREDVEASILGDMQDRHDEQREAAE